MCNVMKSTVAKHWETLVKNLLYRKEQGGMERGRRPRLFSFQNPIHCPHPRHPSLSVSVSCVLLDDSVIRSTAGSIFGKGVGNSPFSPLSAHFDITRCRLPLCIWVPEMNINWASWEGTKSARGGRCFPPEVYAMMLKWDRTERYCALIVLICSDEWLNESDG